MSSLNNKPSFLRDIVFMVIVAILIGGVNEYLQKYDYDLWKVADSYDKEHGLGKYSTNQPTDVSTQPQGESTVDESTTQEVQSTPKKGVVYIHGFGDYNTSDLITVKNSIESFYGLTCVISDPVSSPSSGYYYTGSYVMAYRVLMMGNEDRVNRNVYVTSEPLCMNDENTSLISGHARLNTTACVVSTYQMTMNGRDIPSALRHTINHELAHNFGLEHCDNQNCLMKSHGLDTHELCDNCKRKLN